MPDATPATTWELTDIHHIGMTVSDIDRSVRFYRDVLGMTLIRRRQVSADYVAQQTGYEGVELSVASFKISPDSKQSLEIVQYMNHVGEPSDQATNRPGNSHLCVLVRDFYACYEDLKANDVRFKSEPVTITSGPNKGGMVVYLYDPDGHTIELFQPASGAKKP